MFRAVRVATRALAGLAALCVIAIGGAPASANGDPSTATYTLPQRAPSAQARPDLEARLLGLVNQQRGARGLRPLVPHAGLSAVARAHGRELFAYGVFSHRSRDGRMPAQRVRDRGVRARMVGENLAYATDVHTAHARLMASAPHRRNILSPRFDLVGIAVMDGGAGLLVVQIFTDAPAVLAARGQDRRADR